ncbi:Ig-like domain-containing protein [Flammeovirga sp. EKP202]|uniref:Ig-like domain-containing protein n=1 Tax=Flammeovirga sp. EKP202 TaxID=2770592 RepID=UPI00165FD9C3|nr:Ig-like domain-containing protein [Flammeovirga sp. EKP202]MBD0405069.1 Ig-like domain-containing protein [Flammeovirga sp. EKP202]
MNFRQLPLVLLMTSGVLFSACTEDFLPKESQQQEELNHSSSARTTLLEGEVVLIQTPTEGDEFILGSTFTVEGITDETVDLVACRLWIDGIFYDLDKEPPYTFDVSGLTLGEHILMMRANGADGEKYDSEEVTVNIVEYNAPGTTIITSVANGDTFAEGEDILISSTNEDEDGVKNVRLWIDGLYYDINKEAPFDFSINHLEEGTHSITLKMKDEKDQLTVSETVTIDIVKAKALTKEIVWDDFNLTILPYVRMSGNQDIIFNNSTIGTTEFLILSASHGNPPAGSYEKESHVEGGSWTKVGYGGDDDKSAEVWVRQVTSDNQNNLGQIDTKNASASLSILTYDGLINTGTTQNLQFFNTKASIDHQGEMGPFLVVIATDNGKESTNSNLNYGYKDNGNLSDDMTMLYLTHEDQFYDNSFSVRGGAVSIQLIP